VFTTARRESVAGIEHLVRQERASWVCTSRSKVGIVSMHWSVRKVRCPEMASSPSADRMVIGPPVHIVPDFGAGPQGALHS
jgi:hypothetical protein